MLIVSYHVGKYRLPPAIQGKEETITIKTAGAHFRTLISRLYVSHLDWEGGGGGEKALRGDALGEGAGDTNCLATSMKLSF